MTVNEFLHYRFLGNTIGTYLVCGAILLMGYAFKTLLSRLLSRLLFRFLRKQTEGVSERQFQALLIKPISAVIFLTTVFLAFKVLDYPVRTSDLDKSDHWLELLAFRFYQVGFIAAVCWIILRLIDFSVLVFSRRAELLPARLNNQLIPFAKDLVKVFVLIITFLIILAKGFGVNVTALVGGLGIGGLAVAFAAKESLENLIASFTIFLDRPFAVGDLVTVGGVTGTVEKVGFRSTRLRTIEKSYVTVPNKSMIDKPLDNLSLRTARRVNFTLTISHETTSDQLRRIIAEATDTIRAHPLTTPEVLLQFSALTPTAKEALVQYFVETNDYSEYMAVKEELNYVIVEAVERNGGKFANILASYQLPQDRLEGLQSVTQPVLGK
jgi:MscS family membrane protein